MINNSTNSDVDKEGYFALYFLALSRANFNVFSFPTEVRRNEWCERFGHRIPIEREQIDQDLRLKIDAKYMNLNQTSSLIP